MGTPDFGVPSLDMLVGEGYNVKACITQPDRRAGRGHKLVPPPVKVAAERHGIPVYQFEKVSAEGAGLLEEIAPDVMVTAAFGHILTERVLSIPKYGCINVHASLLPRLRGAAPIQWAIINGDKRTGITTMFTVKALDAGDILEQDAIDIPDDMTAGELYGKLSLLGAETLRRTLVKLADGTLERRPQDEGEATYYPMFKKGFGEIDFSKTSEEIRNFVRGTNPSPGAFMRYGEEKIKVYGVSPAHIESRAVCGEVLAADDKTGLLIKTGDGALSIDLLKRQGAKLMAAKESLRGRGIEKGYVFKKEDGA